MSEFSVGLVGSGPDGQVWRFETEAEAAEFISTLPDHEDGRYYLDSDQEG